MQLTNGQIIQLGDAFNRLDSFKFSGVVRYTLSKNLRRLREAIDDINDSRKKLGESLGMWQKRNDKGEIIADPADVLAKFEKEWESILNAQTEILLTALSLKELDLDANAIPITALAALDLVIKQE